MGMSTSEIVVVVVPATLTARAHSPPTSRTYTRRTRCSPSRTSVIRQPMSSRAKNRSPSSSTYTCGPVWSFGSPDQNRTGFANVLTLSRAKNTKIVSFQTASGHQGTSSRAVIAYTTFAWVPAYDGSPYTGIWNWNGNRWTPGGTTPAAWRGTRQPRMSARD